MSPTSRPLARALGPLLGLATLLSACVQTCACAPTASQGAAARFDGARALRDVERLVGFGRRVSGSPEIEETRVFLEAELEAAGLSPRREAFTAPTPAGKIDFCNVYADLPGRPSAEGGPAPMVILAAHFDLKRLPFDFPGANDSASGTAVLLGVARTLAAEPERRPLTYRFLFLDGEEAVNPQWVDPDNRYGSRYHAQQLVETGEVDGVGACLVIDLVGDEDLRLFRESYSDSRVLGAFFDAARERGLGRYVSGPAEQVYDDHLSFLDAGIPSAVLIDLDYGPGNAYWHRPEDSLEHVSQESLQATGEIVLAGLPRLEAWLGP